MEVDTYRCQVSFKTSNRTIILKPMLSKLLIFHRKPKKNLLHYTEAYIRKYLKISIFKHTVMVVELLRYLTKDMLSRMQH